MIKIYVLGEAKGAYRTQNIIKYILDRQNDYKLLYNSFYANNIVLRYLRSVLFGFFTALSANIVYVTTLNVDINIIWELIWAKVLRKRIIIDYYVSVYDTVVTDRKWFREKSLMSRVARLIDKFYLWVGTDIIFLNKTEQNRYSTFVGMPKDMNKFHIIPLCTEKNGEVKSKFLYENNSEINICWWGSYLPLHGLENLFEAMKILKESGVNIHWYFFGNDSKRGKKYRDLVETLELDNYTFRDDATFNNGVLSKFLEENCDLALGNFGDSEKSRNVLINKILDAAAMKVNLLTCYSEAVMEYFDEEKNLFMCECNGESIATAIVKFIDSSKEDLKERIDNAYDVYEKNFSVDSFLDNFAKLLRKGKLNGKKDN